MLASSSAQIVAPLLTLELRYEHDVVLARQRARQLAAQVGFDVLDQTQFATSVSELARNAREYAGSGRVRFVVQRDQHGDDFFVARVQDEGPGIQALQSILDGQYVSQTGMGLGILGARRLNDLFSIESSPGQGTTVVIGRRMPRSRTGFRAEDAARISAVLASTPAGSSYEEVQQQNQELLAAMEEVRAKQAQVERLNAELEETNRGVVALYAELDDRASDLKRASEYKSRFLSDISHELRTPLTSVLNLSRLLLDHTDGDLSTEQDHQVRLISSAVSSVIELVNELLDLARIEAGKTILVHSTFTVGDVLAALRAICRPLLIDDAIGLIVEDRTGNATLHTDEKRLSQILRNFLSNAIKFTEHGEIRVVATVPHRDTVRFDVIDTGIGIAASDLTRVFDDFVQVDGPIQRRVRGTGLGLPLTRKLAEVLGGSVDVRSEVGKGSTFGVLIPLQHAEAPQ